MDGRDILMPIPPRPFFRSISVYRSIVPPTMFHPRALANSVMVVPSEGLVQISGKVTALQEWRSLMGGMMLRLLAAFDLIAAAR